MTSHVKQILGPTLGKDEQVILNHRTECPIVRHLLQSLEEEAAAVREQLSTEAVEIIDDFWKRTKDLCKDLEQRGIQIDVAKFQQLMGKAIQDQNRARAYDKSKELKSLEKSVIDAVQEDGRIYPTITSESAVTGRITVNGPALQNLPSAVRKSILPKASGNHLYYLDYKSMEPCIFAALSKDEFLVEDILSDDFYSVLASGLFNDAGGSEPSNYRDDIKTLFLATFMYGGDINYNISKLKLPIQANQWHVLLKKYDVGHAYKSDIIQKKQCRSLIGTPYDFNRAEVNIFNRFMQSEAALIFKQVLLDLSELEQAQNFKMILPIHDAVLIEADSFDTANTVAVEMENSFNQIVDMNIAKVTVQTLTSGGDSNEQQ